MPSIGPSFFILGVVMVTVIAAQAPPISPTTEDSTMTMTTASYTDITTMTTPAPLSSKPNDSTTSINNNTSIDTNTGINNNTGTNISTSTIATSTEQKGNESSNATTPTMPTTTPKSSTTMTSIKTTSPKAQKKSADIGIIILVVIIIACVAFGLACFCARRRGRRQSVDFNSRPDEANIPLSTISPEMPADAAPQNGLQTFQSTESNAKESLEPEAKPLVQEEQKAEADKSVGNPSAESADSSGDKPKEDVAEKSPPAPVEPNAEEKTDDEGIVSNKTSVESLKETNENNSNNADVTQKKDWKMTGVFWDVSLDSPV